MRTTGLKPNTLIQTALKDAERALRGDSKANKAVTQAGYAKLPPALQGVVDDFRAAGHEQVKTNDILGALKSSLEAGLKQSLQRGELVPGEMSDDLAGLLSYSAVGVQVQRAVAERAAQGPSSFADAAQDAQIALDQADEGVTSQLGALKTLRNAAQLAREEAPDQAPLLDGLAQDRAKLLRKVADNTVKGAQAQLKADPDADHLKLQLAVALDAAQQVHQAVNPRSSRLKTLRNEQAKLGVELPQRAAAQPFFARFLEQQSRGETPRNVEEPEPNLRVTLKYPSDGEDSGGGSGFDPNMVTLKAPSDSEDGGVDLPDINVTMKYPSDNEDGGGDDVGGPGGGFTTLKYPSDNEDGGGGDDVGGPGGPDGPGGPGNPGDMVTLKFPSDNEDGGGGDDGNIFVTLKYPSDNEDGGGGLIPEIAPEIQPEIMPEIAPEIRPEVVVEIAPEVGPGRMRADTIAASSMEALYWGGYEKIDRRADELERLLQVARMTPEARANTQAELGALRGLSEGGEWVGRREDELQHLLEAGNLTPEGESAVLLERAVNKLIYGGLHAGFLAPAEKLERQRHRSEGEQALVGALRAAWSGREAIEARMAELKPALEQNDGFGFERTVTKAEYAGLKAMLGGGDFLQKKINELQDLLISAGMTPELHAEVQAEMTVLRGLHEGMRVIRDFTSPGPIPEIAPEIQPEVIIEVAPEIRPEVIVEVAPETQPSQEFRGSLKFRALIPYFSTDGRSYEVVANSAQVKGQLDQLRNAGADIDRVVMEGYIGDRFNPRLNTNEKVFYATSAVAEAPPLPEIAPEIMPEIRPEIIPGAPPTAAWRACRAASTTSTSCSSPGA
jgi:hypothetical protein